MNGADGGGIVGGTVAAVQLGRSIYRRWRGAIDQESTAAVHALRSELMPAVNELVVSSREATQAIGSLRDRVTRVETVLETSQHRPWWR